MVNALKDEENERNPSGKKTNDWLTLICNGWIASGVIMVIVLSFIVCVHASKKNTILLCLATTNNFDRSYERFRNI